MNNSFTPEQEKKNIRYIVGEYKTKSIDQIHAEMINTHPHLKLTKSQIGNIIKRMKKCYDTKIAECNANKQFDEALKIMKKKHITLPDKRSKRLEAAKEVVAQDIIQTIADADLALLNNSLQSNQEDTVIYNEYS